MNLDIFMHSGMSELVCLARLARSICQESQTESWQILACLSLCVWQDLACIICQESQTECRHTSSDMPKSSKIHFVILVRYWQLVLVCLARLSMQYLN